jgi:quercetin dioxygenase-like cupin family protein
MAQADTEPGRSARRLGPPGTLLFENDRVRIWELIMKPGEVSNWHDHTGDHLLVLVDGASIADLSNGATPDTASPFEISDGQVLFIPGTPGVKEWPINMSKDRTLRELIIDLKPGAVEAGQQAAIVPFFRPETPSTTWTPDPAEYGVRLEDH